MAATLTTPGTRGTGSASGCAQGRTLVLVDLENLCGPSACAGTVRSRLRRLRRFAGLAEGDHVVIAANQQLLFSARDAEPGARLLVSDRQVANSADLALCDVAAEALEARTRGGGYTRVVIGSGDAIFCSVARRLQLCGITVEVAAPTGSCSEKLARLAGRLQLLGRPALSRRAA